jgi:acetylornithine deacetylase/succinyl-diaminopimelate desuccinylase-like protein
MNDFDVPVERSRSVPRRSRRPRAVPATATVTPAPRAAPGPTAARAAEAAYARALVERIVAECPRRQATSESERRAHAIVRAELEKLGLATCEQGFRFNDSLYENLLLHFGLGAAAHLLGGALPGLGAALHGLVATSYWGDSTRRFYLLRRLLGFRPSRNVLATLPAADEPALRVVFLAHVDAAFTGVMFDPRVASVFAAKPPRWLRFMSRSLAVTTRAEAALAAIGLARALLGPLGLPLRPLEWVLSLPTWIAFALALEIVLRDEVVPGAADNLSAVAAMLLLAARLAPKKPEDVELVFVATGCEEASLGGADALVREMGPHWDRDRTVVIALDTLSNGRLHFVDREGEVVSVRPPAWLTGLIREVAAADPRFAEVSPLDIPVGGTDAAPFQYHGYAATGFVRTDPAVGMPRHYHQPTDTPENIDPDEIVASVDFIEAVVAALVARGSARP